MPLLVLRLITTLSHLYYLRGEYSRAIGRLNVPYGASCEVTATLIHFVALAI